LYICTIQVLKLKLNQWQNPEKINPSPGVQPPQTHAHRYIGPWAAEENLNDSEWRKGEGIVPINRNYDQTIEGPKSAEEKSSELSPENYACQDYDLPLVQYLTAEVIVSLQENKGQLSSTNYILKYHVSANIFPQIALLQPFDQGALYLSGLGRQIRL
jgi:hypothetical protein